MTTVSVLDLGSRPTYRLTMADGAQLAVWDSGGGAARPAVVLVHGFPENRLCWQPVLRALADGGPHCRWVAYDLRGFGHSDREGEASWQQMVADHLELVRQLELEGSHLVGHDWGAAIAMHLGRLAPEALATISVLNTTFWKIDYLGMWHLWLLNLPLLPPLLFRRWPEWFFARTMLGAFRDPGRLSPVARASYLEMYRDQDTTRFWIRLYRQTLRTTLRAALPRPLRGGLGASRVHLPRPSERAYRLPMQLVWGVDDTFCPLWVGRAIHSRLQGLGTPVELHEVADSGHFVTEEQPEVVAGLLADFIRRHDACGVAAAPGVFSDGSAR
jgi:pimeloyl-ACP methyl ester carboxylesterase